MEQIMIATRSSLAVTDFVQDSLVNADYDNQCVRITDSVRNWYIGTACVRLAPPYQVAISVTGHLLVRMGEVGHCTMIDVTGLFRDATLFGN
ncbi:hypothetical protein Peur_063062 [Populus x canadensis]